jgi:hypothetical protein
MDQLIIDSNLKQYAPQIKQLSIMVWTTLALDEIATSLNIHDPITKANLHAFQIHVAQMNGGRTNVATATLRDDTKSYIFNTTDN